MKSQPIFTMRCSSRLLVPAMLVAVGCAFSRSHADEPVGTDEADDVVVHILSWDEIREMVRSEYQGRVVVMNLWTTTCAACVADFPEFAGLQDRFNREEFAYLSLNCDYDGIPGKPPEYYRDRVMEFLKQQPDGIEHVMLSNSMLDFMEELELDSTPALFVFDRNGRLNRRFDNDNADSTDDEFTVEQIEETVRELLK